MVGSLEAARGACARARPLRVLDPRPGRPLHPRRPRRSAGDRHRRRLLGAYHAVNFALKRADLFPLALGLSGNYDPSSWDGWGERGAAAYFNNPLDYLEHAGGDHLDWLRATVSILLVCGQGQWEDTTGALESSKRLGALLDRKQIRHELDLWGHDVPHDWPSWRAQLAHHLPRFC
jgi:esterase/lipase superfamily enzyme